MFPLMNTMPTMVPQPVGPFFPCAVNQALMASRQTCMFQNYPSIHVVPTPPGAVPPQPTILNKGPYLNRTDRHRFLLKSVFTLVYENIYLALTDSKLLGWYLGLSPEDRKLIQDEGGFHHFLKKHPALELSKHHIYVKNVVPEELREHFPLHNNSSNQHPSASYSSPAKQRVDPKVQELNKLAFPMANSSGGIHAVQSPETANLSLDVELERHIQGVNPQSTLAGVVLQRPWHHSNSHDALLWESEREASLNNNSFYSVLEADNSIVLCVPKESPETAVFHSGDCASQSDPSLFESIIRNTEDRSTSPIPPVSTCDAMVGTEQTMTISAINQTELQSTVNKCLNTEVYMLDLDYLTKEFIAIKTERDELLEKVKIQRTAPPFAKIVNDLKKLETDYNKMREKILSGISLQDLKPLSLELEKGSKDPAVAKIIGDIQIASQGAQKQENVVNDEPAISDNSSSLESETERENATEKEQIKIKRAVTHVLKETLSSPKAEGKALTDLNSNEAWYDAEEVLSSEICDEQLKADEKPDASDMEDDKCMSAGLFVSGLPINTTEKDVLCWFEKHHASDVHISKLKELSVAIVIVGSRQYAEAAVKELNGLKIKGHTLRVEHINSGQSLGQGQSSSCDIERSHMNQLTSSSSPKKKVVCVSPTAQGTFVPQHYGTMGSFDILMSELKMKHPNVARQRIVDALLELRAKYRGVLSGLPLRTIRDMTSDLLTRPACNTSN